MTHLPSVRIPYGFLLRPLTLVATVSLWAACGGSNRAPDATVTADARVSGNPRFVDRDDDKQVGAGDTVMVRFDRPVTVRQSTVAFQLAVDGDSFGSGARMEDGERPEEVRIVLGPGAKLRTRGRNARDSAGSASGLSLASTGAIVDRARQAPVAADAVRDLASGFLVEALPGLADDAEAIVAGDLDGDGDLDLVVGRSGAGAQVLRNQGGTFTNSGQLLAAGAALALGDLDADGDSDLVVGSDRVASSIWRNDGAGQFSELQALAPLDTRSVALADLDRDGDIDLVRGNGSGATDEIWWNDGSGQLVLGRRSLAGTPGR